MHSVYDLIFYLLVYSPAIVFVGGIVFIVYSELKRSHRNEYIDKFHFHTPVINKFREVRPNLSKREEELVFAALKNYFHLCNLSGRRMVSMPSQVVDDAWHAFILYTRSYQRFCRNAFGRYLHHTPAEAMSSSKSAGAGIRRAWRLACAHERINPKKPSRLPLLFSIDADLGVENSFFRVPDSCRGMSETGASGVDLDLSDIASFFGSDENSGVDGDGGGCGGGCGGD